MKKRYILIAIWFLVFGLTGFISARSSKVYALAPTCYKVKPDKTVVEKDCKSPLFSKTAVKALGHPLKDDFCYIAKTGFIEKAVNSEPCKKAARDAAEPGKTPGSTSGDADLDTSSISNPQRDEILSCDGSESCFNKNPIVVMAKLAVNILTALVGVVTVGVIVFAGIQYSSSGGDPGKTADAKKRIINAIIALVAFMFLYIALQWLVPGGLF